MILCCMPVYKTVAVLGTHDRSEVNLGNCRSIFVVQI